MQSYPQILRFPILDCWQTCLRHLLNMPDKTQKTSADDAPFSWEKWFRVGLHAFKKTLTHYNFGMPDEFWQHLEAAFDEFLAAMRIALRSILARRRGAGKQTPPSNKNIDIEWDDDDWDDWEVGT